MTKTTTWRREIDSLTTLRGVLACWVVVYHFGVDVARLVPGSAPLNPVLHKGYMAVPGFFILSGFVLAYNYAPRFLTLPLRGVVRFWLLRFARIYPVHLVTLLAVAVMVGVSGLAGFQLTSTGYTTRDFVLNLFLMQTWVPNFTLNWNYPAWSISSEWFAYLFFPFVCGVVLRRLTTRLRTAAFTAACLCGTVAVYSFAEYPFQELVIVIPTFLAGMAVYTLTRSAATPAGRFTRRLPDVALAAGVAACFAPLAWAIPLILLALFGLVLALARAADRPPGWWVWPPAVFLGEVSYSLYMTHTLVQKVTNRLLPSARFEDAGPVARFGVVAVYVGLIAVVCLGSYYLVEKPCREWARRRLSRAEPGRGPTPPGAHP